VLLVFIGSHNPLYRFKLLNALLIQPFPLQQVFVLTELTQLPDLKIFLLPVSLDLLLSLRLFELHRLLHLQSMLLLLLLLQSLLLCFLHLFDLQQLHAMISFCLL
jgi:hypothetical protein